MKSRHIKDLMVPISDYATIHADATIGEAILALENQNQRHGEKPYRHQSLIVIDGNRRVVGRLSQVDIMRAMEPRYMEIGDASWVRKSVFDRRALKEMREKFELWERPLDEMCRDIGNLKVKDYMQAPADGEFVDEDDTMNIATHRTVMGRHHSLLVTRNGEIVGILRSTDLFNTLYDTLAACQAR